MRWGSGSDTTRFSVEIVGSGAMMPARSKEREIKVHSKDKSGQVRDDVEFQITNGGTNVEIPEFYFYRV